MTITAVILIHQPDQLLTSLISSLDFADEIFLIRDGQFAFEIPLPENVRIFDFPVHRDFAAARNLAISKSSSDWLLFIDSDESVSRQLASEITDKVRSNPTQKAYYLRRYESYFGQTLKHGDGSTCLIRLAKKNAGKFIRPVHEKWQIRGKIGRLDSPLIHSHQNLVSLFLAKIQLYSPIDAQSLSLEGKPFSYPRLLINPPAKFFFNYFVKLGFLDGYLGLFHAYMMSVQSLSVRVVQWLNR